MRITFTELGVRKYTLKCVRVRRTSQFKKIKEEERNTRQELLCLAALVLEEVDRALASSMKSQGGIAMLSRHIGRCCCWAGRIFAFVVSVNCIASCFVFSEANPAQAVSPSRI